MFLPVAPGHNAPTDDTIAQQYAEKIERWAAAIMDMIEMDETYGHLRGHTIRCFDDLDGVVDRAQYDMDAGVPWGTDAEALGMDPVDLVNLVQKRVDELLHARPYDAALTHKTDADLPSVTATIVFYFKTEDPTIVDDAAAKIRAALITTADADVAELADVDLRGLTIIAANYLGIPWLFENLPHVFQGYGVGVDEADASW